jgi:diguanylate cyclase (GGDEF)-like protein
LDYLAYYDALTGLANRTLFLERLEERLLAARKSGNRLAVTVLEIERLQSINDGFGRSAGDELLGQVADRLTRLRGDATRLARIGTAVFGVVSADVQNEGEAARMTEHKLQACFDPPFPVGDQELRIPAKAGIAMYPNDGDEAEVLLRCAEAALKRAVNQGERYLFFEPQMTERIAERLSLENELRRAIDQQEFVLAYQPKVELESGALAGIEALLRWQSPTRGLVSPVYFIPVLEETGLILQVGTWVLHRAALDHRRWTEAGLNAPRVAVNVSALQLRQKDFVDVVLASIGTHGAGIDLEVTESLVIEDIGTTVDKLRALRATGVGIALDDFGTGYSSLAYLARLPIETLKIDRSFIKQMLSDPDTLTLVRTIITMAHSLRLKVVAEGVETHEQAAALRQLQCDQMQGYLVSKPIAFEDMTLSLKQWGEFPQALT